MPISIDEFKKLPQKSSKTVAEEKARSIMSDVEIYFIDDSERVRRLR